MESFHAVGIRTPRSDGVSKVTGSGVFAADVTLPGMLYGRILRSPYAKAVVEDIDVSKAEKLGAICATFRDVPNKLFNPRLVSTLETTYKDWTVLTDRPNYAGEPVAVVASESEQAAQAAVEAIKVKYRVLEPCFDSLESLKGRKTVHASILLADKEIKVDRNVGCKMHVEEGDLAKGFANADIILERQYKTNRRYHAQLETKAVVCRPEPGGGVTIWCTTQTIHNTRILIHEIFAIPMNLINVKKTVLGGSFGSSIHTNILVPICVAISLKARRPVKIVYT